MGGRRSHQENVRCDLQHVTGKAFTGSKIAYTSNQPAISHPRSFEESDCAAIVKRPHPLEGRCRRPLLLESSVGFVQQRPQMHNLCIALSGLHLKRRYALLCVTARRARWMGVWMAGNEGQGIWTGVSKDESTHRI